MQCEKMIFKVLSLDGLISQRVILYIYINLIICEIVYKVAFNQVAYYIQLHGFCDDKTNRVEQVEVFGRQKKRELNIRDQRRASSIEWDVEGNKYALKERPLLRSNGHPLVAH